MLTVQDGIMEYDHSIMNITQHQKICICFDHMINTFKVPLAIAQAITGTIVSYRFGSASHIRARSCSNWRCTNFISYKHLNPNEFDMQERNNGYADKVINWMKQ